MEKKQKEKTNDIPPQITIKARIDYLMPGSVKGTVATASINIADAFVVKGVRIIEGERGLFVSMPSSSYTNRQGEKEYQEIAFPLTKELREQTADAVLSAYQQTMAEMMERTGELRQTAGAGMQMQ